MEKRDFQRSDELRRRFLLHGSDALAPAEALELLLDYVSPRKDCQALSYELLRTYGSLSNLLASSADQLQRVGGLSESAALLLTLVSQTNRHIFLEEAERREGAFESVSETGRYFMELVKGERRETFYELCLSKPGTFLSCVPLTDGGALSPEMDVPAVMIRRAVESALVSSANLAVICRHQPGGLLAPSVTDRLMIRKLRDALRTVRVALQDYYIVTDDDFISLSETGALEPEETQSAFIP